MTMTNRERMLAILAKKSPDRIPWVPRLQIWYNARLKEGNMPERFRGMTLREIERALRVGTPARDGKVFKERHEGLEVVVRREGGEETTEFVTPCGTAVLRTAVAESLAGYVDEGLDVGFPIQTEKDYDVWEYVVEHTYYDPTYEVFLAYDASIGDEGLPLVPTGDVPFHHFCRHLAGYNQAYFELYDRTERVERLLRVMEDVERERLWPVVAQSPARLIRHGSHFDSQMTPPHLFERYIKPYYQDFSKILHAHDKVLTFHADNDSRLILQLTKDSGFDMGECFATAPLVNCTLEEARAVWGTDVIIFGGVPSTILEPTFPEEEFEEYMLNLFRTIAPGDAFILGVADNTMPDALIERIERISDLVEEHGNYPIRVPATAATA
ncbi:MAG: hypothetical protein HY331_17755 [Chloroflexi bacterium]|nr:hypothetical protein [Chloroflexota bacterium]